MDGSGTIRIEKRDGQLEPFSSGKLTLCLCRVLQEESRGYADARHLCDAIRIYLLRSGRMRVCSAAVFEMALQVLRRIRRPDAADRLEAHHRWRQRRRAALRIRHDTGEVTLWDKTWLAELAGRYWGLMRPTARILANAVEAEMLKAGGAMLSRQHVLERLNARVAEYGLADAVPVQ